ncbi:hypothetical protein [Reinekea sp. G2M2-21]|uniref:hypothetical protein n=1 Tax=Reinekea sp. G2M2-21 TaxID=2788942 RepID=UPI0018A8F329|nr:hypothetical protein [Reinekea sp. G2M2-21]
MSESILKTTFTLNQKQDASLMPVLSALNAEMHGAVLSLTKEKRSYTAQWTPLDYDEELILKVHQQIVFIGAKNLISEFYFEETHESVFLSCHEGKLISADTPKELNQKIADNKNKSGVIFKLKRTDTDDYAVARFLIPKKNDRQFYLQLFQGLADKTPQQSLDNFTDATLKKFRKWDGRPVSWCQWVAKDRDSGTEKVYQGYKELVQSVEFSELHDDCLYVAFDLKNTPLGNRDFKAMDFDEEDAFDAMLQDTSVALGMLRGVKHIFIKYRLAGHVCVELNVAGVYGGIDYHHRKTDDNFWERTWE